MNTIVVLGVVLLAVALMLFMLPLLRQKDIRWKAIIPGVIALITITFGMYATLGSYQQIAHKEKAMQELPELSKRVLETEAAPSVGDVRDLMLALRVKQKQNPRDVEGWILLGRLGDWMGNGNYAMDAFSRAYNADPDSLLGMSTFTDVLVESGQDDLQQRAIRIYNRYLVSNPDAMRVRFKLAMLLMKTNRNQQAVDQWQEILTRLPEESDMRPMIEQSLQMAMDRS